MVEPSGATVSLVCVAYHRSDALRTLLAGTASPRIEQIVVNVESDEEIARIGAEAGATVANLPDNLGYAAGVNLGATRASAPIVVFSNDDLVCNAAVVVALAEVVASGRADVAVPHVVDGSGQSVRTVQSTPSIGSLVREWLLLPDEPVPWLRRRLNVEKWREPDATETIGAASAVMVATSRSLLLEVPMPEEYFMYWEESEWFSLLRRRGATVVYEPSLTVSHRGGRGVVNPAKSRLLAVNAVKCIRRLDGRPRSAVAYVVVLGWQARLLATALVRRALGRPGAGDLLAARLAGLSGALGAWREVIGS